MIKRISSFINPGGRKILISSNDDKTTSVKTRDKKAGSTDDDLDFHVEGAPRLDTGRPQRRKMKGWDE